MSSSVLARKYRPRDFEALVGQEHVVQALMNALTHRRLHHAYLFTGTRGVGKTTVSRILAKSLNCTGREGEGDITAKPCGVCAACTEIDAGRFIDYVELDAASNRGVEEISQLLSQAAYKPVLGRFKVYMIDEVHMLSTTAFNAMLKTLEEPPEYLKFVLATTDPQKVPATVLSRCLQFNLRPMAPQTILQHLTHVLSQEGIQSEPTALRLIARGARGSMRDALSLTDQAIAFSVGRLDEESVRRMLGAVDRGHAVRIVDAIAARDGAALVEAVDALRALGLSAASTLDELCELLQRMAIVQAVAGAGEGNEPGSTEVQRLAKALPADETHLLYSIALHGRADLVASPDEYSGLVMVLLRILAFAPDVEPANKLVAVPATSGAGAGMPPRHFHSTPASATGAPEAALSTTTAAPAPSQNPVQAVEPPGGRPVAEVGSTAAPIPLPESHATREADRWATIVRQMVDSGLIDALVRELAMHAQCTAIDESTKPALWSLRVERENLRTPAQVKKLEAALRQTLQRAVRIEVQPGVAEGSLSQRDQAEHERSQRAAEALIENDPLVRSLLSQYQGARIVPGSIKPH